MRSAFLRIGGCNLRLQGIGQLALLLDRGQDRIAPLVQFAQINQPLGQVSQLRIVEPAGDFLAVAGDEGHRRAFIQQPDGRFGLFGFRGDLRRDDRGDTLDVDCHGLPGSGKGRRKIETITCHRHPLCAGKCSDSA